MCILLSGEQVQLLSRQAVRSKPRMLVSVERIPIGQPVVEHAADQFLTKALKFHFHDLRFSYAAQLLLFFNCHLDFQISI